MRISSLIGVLIFAIVTGALVIAIWYLVNADFSASGQSGNSAAVLTDHDRMAAYMPLPPDGWALNNSTGDLVTDGRESFSFARNDYRMPGSCQTASVIIYDSGGKDILWNSIFKTGFIYDDDAGYAKVYTYKGSPAWETARYAAGDNAYSLYVRLSDRYGIAILLKNASDGSALKDFADRMNIYRIAALDKMPG